MAPRKFNKGNTYVVDTDIHGAKPSESSKESNDFKVLTVRLVSFVRFFVKFRFEEKNII